MDFAVPAGGISCLPMSFKEKEKRGQKFSLEVSTFQEQSEERRKSKEESKRTARGGEFSLWMDGKNESNFHLLQGKRA